MKRVMFVLLLAMVIAPEVWAQSWPNEPSGSTTIVDCNMNSMLCGYGGGSAAGGSIITDATAPLSPSSVVEYKLNVGTSNGGGQIIYSFGSTDSFYEGFWWKPSDPFYGTPNCGNKIIGVFMTDGTPVSGLTCETGVNGGPYLWVSTLELPHNNCHLGGWGDCPGTFNLFPNRGSGRVSLGVWHRVEVYMKRSTSSTSRDGTIRFWLDGALIFDYTNVNMPGYFTGTYFTPAWDGSWEPVHPTSFSNRYDHVHLSTGGSGGGTPKGDTTPPSAPAGLRAN
jgi:hypothetical protein